MTRRQTNRDNSGIRARTGNFAAQCVIECATGTCITGDVIRNFHITSVQSYFEHNHKLQVGILEIVNT